eukprot:6493212-Prymnesium_polylepis.1
MSCGIDLAPQRPQQAPRCRCRCRCRCRSATASTAARHMPPAAPTGRVIKANRIVVANNPIVAIFTYKYRSGMQKATDEILETMVAYYKEKGEFGRVLLHYSFAHNDDMAGYCATEVFPSAQAFNTHITNTLAFPEKEKLFALPDMIVEESSTIYATAAELEKAPQIRELYPE